MTKINFLLLLFCTMNICFSQKNEIENEFLKNFFSHKDTLIYTSESFGWNIMKEKFNKKKYKDYNLNNTNTIQFTDKEYQYIKNEISTLENYFWNSNLFDNSEKIELEEVESYLKKRNEPYRLEFENISINDTSATVEMKNKNYIVYSFSKPIFFRKNKFCLFGYSVNSEKNFKPYKRIAFWRKKRGKWIEWLDLYNNID